MLNFIKFSPLYFILSAVFIIPSLFSLATYGLKPSIDFTGGSLLEYQITPVEGVQVNEDIIKSHIKDFTEISSIQTSGSNSYIIRSKPITSDQNREIKMILTEKIGQIDEIRFETVGPTLGKELLQKTYIAIALATAAILLYVAYQFKELKYGVCAVIAMFHDTLILVGAFSILGHYYGVEVDTLFVTAVLTILSFSVHDTIVVYDRIRETLRRHSNASFPSIVNTSIAETLARSINNSMTIIFMLTALWLLGGTTIKWFIFALLIGTITGTYSSTFTAAPLLVVWEKLINKKK